MIIVSICITHRGASKSLNQMITKITNICSRVNVGITQRFGTLSGCRFEIFEETRMLSSELCNEVFIWWSNMLCHVFLRYVRIAYFLSLAWLPVAYVRTI